MRSNLNDPRRIPYLLIWKDTRDGEIKESVRLAHFTACGREGNDYAELKRTDGSITFLRIVWRTLPRNGGRALFLLCPCCERPRRFVYGWEWNRFSGRIERRYARWLAMPILCPVSLLFRRWLSSPWQAVPRFRKLTSPGIVVSCLHLH